MNNREMFYFCAEGKLEILFKAVLFIMGFDLGISPWRFADPRLWGRLYSSAETVPFGFVF